MRMEELVASEGIPDVELPAGIVKGNDLLSASEHFFRFVLGDGDPRWNILAKFVQAKKETGFRKIHTENALLAIYLSDAPSFRYGYSSFSSLQSIRQLCRAVQNLAVFNTVKDLFDKTELETRLPDPLNIKLVRSNRILSGTDSNGVTGCPEALYQIRMFMSDKYLGRVGFNVHHEGEAMVLSVANLQGVPNGGDIYQHLRDQFNIKPFNTLLQRLKVMTAESSVAMTLRGLKNPVCATSAGLYNTLFVSEGIKRYSFNRVKH